MNTSAHSRSKALIVFDACTLNPYKNFKTTKVRLKKKLQVQLRDQPRIIRLISELKQGNGFSITQFLPIAVESWGHGSDEEVLDKLEDLAEENPDQLVIFITRDLSFCQAAGWRPELSRVFICILPLRFFTKTIDQYSRYDMMLIISKDIKNLFTYGQVTFSRLYTPTYSKYIN